MPMPLRSAARPRTSSASQSCGKKTTSLVALGPVEDDPPTSPWSATLGSATWPPRGRASRVPEKKVEAATFSSLAVGPL
eukprot:5874101-Pyramimonas_sp.AAC.1